MNDVATLLTALHGDPADATAWLALADALEESGQPKRAELVRVTHSRPVNETKMRELLATGVTPSVPELTNSIGMRFALIPAGSFLMGSPPDQPHRDPEEGPLHQVDITRAFYMGVFTVTQREYAAIMGENPSYFNSKSGRSSRVWDVDCDRLPVECVSREDAIRFCQRLTDLPAEKEADRVYWLPTEAQWEYACRAGTTTVFHFGDDLSANQANFDGNLPYGNGHKARYLQRTSIVGSYPPNAFGLYDMHGNVWEWCHDYFDAGYYKDCPRADPRGPEGGDRRILRGGSWKNQGFYLRSSHRGWSTPDERIGFRVTLEHPCK